MIKYELKFVSQLFCHVFDLYSLVASVPIVVVVVVGPDETIIPFGTGELQPHSLNTEHLNAKRL